MISRRDLLAGAALGLSGLAGCVSDQGSEGPTATATPSGATSGVFERVAVEGTTLVIELAEDSDVDTVNVIAPNGELYRRLAVYRGVTRLSTEIDETYTPGVYEILGIRRSQSKSSVQLEIAPQLEIIDVSLEADGRVKFPEGLGRTSASELAVSVMNTGSGPAFIQKLLVLGDVPNPTTELLDGSVDRSGMFDTDSNRFYADGATIAAGEAAVLFSDTLAFSFVGGGWDCQSEARVGQAEITVQTRQTDQSVSVTKAVRYGTLDADGSCTVRIDEGL